MSTNYHTQIPIAASAVPATLNSPLGELDAAIYRGIGGGTSFPGSPTEGDLFYRTDSHKRYQYNGSTWDEVSTGGTSGGVVDVEGSDGEALSERDIVYLASDSDWYKVDIDASPIKLSAIRGFVEESGGISGGTGTIRLAGVLGGFTGLTAGSPVYASTVAGGYTQTRPAVADGGNQQAIVMVGTAISTTEVLIMPYHVEFAKRATLSNNGTLTIEHYADANTMTRDIVVTILTSDAGSSLTSYDETNRDVGVWLRGPTGAGGTTSNATGGSSNSIGDSGASLRWRSQGLQVTAGQLSQIKFTLLANTGSPSGTMTWEIQSDDSGKPSKTVLQSGTLTPTASAENTINVTDGIFLAGSTTYHLVLRPTTPQSAGNAWNWSVSGANPYASGDESQSQDSGATWSTDTGYDNVFSITTSATIVRDKSSQSFQVTGAQTIGSVKLWMCKFGSPAGTMTLRVETDSSGDPSGSLVDANATTTVDESTLSTSYGWITFTFATSFNVSGSTTYHIVLSTDRTASDTNYVATGADASTPGYANGDMRYYESSAWSTESKDACFDVLGEDTTYQEPVVVGRWSGGTRDCAVRHDDGSAANPTTKTTFKNVTGSSVDMTCIVRMQ